MRFLLAAFVVLFSFPALAQLDGADSAPGDDCSAFSAGTTRMNASAAEDGGEVLLICDGTVWQSANTGSSGSGASIFTTCTNENSDGDGTDDIAVCSAAATELVTGGTGEDYALIRCRTGSGTPTPGALYYWAGTYWRVMDDAAWKTCIDGTVVIADLTASGGGSGGGSGWEDVSSGDTADFDLTCHYRAGLNSASNTFYSNAVYPGYVIFNSFSGGGSDTEFRILSTSKGSYAARGEGAASYSGSYTVYNLQKNCGSGGGGADTLSGLTCTDGQVAAWDNAGSAWVCADGGSGGSVGTSMVSGWPDAILCPTSDGYTYTFDLRTTGSTSEFVYMMVGTTNNYLRYNSDGTYNSHNNLNTNYECLNKSIATLYSEGNAFNFVGGGSGGGSSWTASALEVHNATAATWTEIDLSATVGSSAALVYLEVCANSGQPYVSVRPAGETDDWRQWSTYAGGPNSATPTTSECSTMITPTSAAGKIEIMSQQSVKVTLQGYVGSGGSGGADTLSGLTCTDGQVAAWDNTGSAWICADGGTGGAGSTMVSGWPDAIQCNVISGGSGTGNKIFYLADAAGGTDFSSAYSGKFVYMNPIADRSNNWTNVAFNSDGTHFEDSYGIVTDCQGETIDDLYTAGKAFNFGGGSGGSGSGTPIIEAIAGKSTVDPVAGLDKWPDYILCKSGSADRVFDLTYYASGGSVIYRDEGTTYYQLNADGTYYGRSNVDANCGAAAGSDIVSICADGRCGFYGGGGSDTLAGLSCTDGQVAAWDNAGSAWVCADGGSGGSGSGSALGVIGFAERTDTGAVTLSGNIPRDNTIPQITEGDELLTVTVDVAEESDFLYFDISGPHWGEVSNTTDGFTVSLFQNGQSGTDALASYIAVGTESTNAGYVSTTLRIPAPVAGTYTYSFRGGINSGSYYLNRGRNYDNYLNGGQNNMRVIAMADNIGGGSGGGGSGGGSPKKLTELTGTGAITHSLTLTETTIVEISSGAQAGYAGAGYKYPALTIAIDGTQCAKEGNLSGNGIAANSEFSTTCVKELAAGTYSITSDVTAPGGAVANHVMTILEYGSGGSGGWSGTATSDLDMATYDIFNATDISFSGILTDTSDARLKDDFQQFPFNAVEKLDSILPVSFVMKDDPGKRREYGFTAQDVQKVLPELVREADDEMKTLSLNYQGLIPVLVKAVQELKAENDALRARVDAMEAE